MDFKEKIESFIAKTKVESGGKRVLTQEQADVFKSVLNSYVAGGTAFVNGAGGSGKSVLINAIKKYCDANKISCVVTGTTGKCSSALGGVTIHSYIGLSMKQNNNADVVEDALLLQRDEKMIEMPDILIIDESSMIGMKLLREIQNVGFKYILFVGDLSQLPAVRDKKVEWDYVIGQHYHLTQNMRAKDERLVKVFDDFRKQKAGELENLDIFDYENGDNIVRYDFNDITTMPANTECSFIGYRNKLVDMMANKLTGEKHNMFNLNIGVNVTALSVVVDSKTGEPVVEDNGYFNREFVNKRAFYNGEDIKIVALDGITKELVSKGYAIYGKWKLKMTKKGIMINDTTAKINFGDKEPMADKFFISFPVNEVLEYTTLSVIDDNVFALVFDGEITEYEDMINFYFDQLHPYLKKYQAVQGYYRKKNVDLSVLDYGVKMKLEEYHNLKGFMSWYESHDDEVMRKKGWKELLQAKSVVTARPTTARTVVKSQGLSIPAVILCRDSLYGASAAAAYVAVSRCSQGIILLDNVPDNWK